MAAAARGRGTMRLALLICFLLKAQAVSRLRTFRPLTHDHEAAAQLSMLARSEEGRAELQGRLSSLMANGYFTSLIENTAQAEADQEAQGDGFTIAFVPQNSTVYNPDLSSTFKVVPHQVGR